MKDVARLAQVSLSTVSRVVNGDATVAAPLATRVRGAIAELGYRRDLTASSLRRTDRATTLIGLVVDDLANPFFGALQRGVEEVARGRGVFALAASSDDEPARERELADTFLARGLDGLIIAPVGPDQTHLEAELAAGPPFVFVDRPPVGLQADVAMIDNTGAARHGVEHLLAAGHRRIAFLGDRQSILPARDRLHGYEQALAGAGIAVDSRLIRVDLQGPTAAPPAC